MVKSAAKPHKRGDGDYNLVIVESPAKAKTIKKYLGKGYQVVASNGHIKDLPKSKLGVDVKKKFAMDIVAITGKKVIIDKITELASHANEIYLAPDPDREGEAIAFHLAEEIRPKNKNIHRVMFNAITKPAVIAAINNPLTLDAKKYDSQRTRRILDRLVGYKISPILWEKVQRGLSAGRVQSVALRIIVEREKEVADFKPEKWFSIHAFFQKDGKLFEARYYGEDTKKKVELTDETVVQKILKDIENKKFNIEEVIRKERRQFPTAPFTTSKLQQEGANKLGFSAKKTMMIAQKLYEGLEIGSDGQQGLITYMRTDSVRIDPTAVTAVREYIKDKYPKEYLPAEPNVYKKKGGSKVQDAHEAIRPTNLAYDPKTVAGDLGEDELKLYTLIWNKFIASQMSPAVIDQTAVFFENSGHYFKANGSIIKFPGFRSVYIEDKIERNNRKKKESGAEEDESEAEAEQSQSLELPSLSEKEVLPATKKPNGEEHWTSPPPRYNEASLVKELEERGIGRPSTYASIISNITDKGYVEKRENRFVPSELGTIVCQLLLQSFPTEMDVDFTAKMENQLDLIEEGEVKWTNVLSDFWKNFEVTLNKAKEEMKNLKKQEIPSGIKCTKCADGEYFVKWGKNGQFLACSNYPDCNSTEDFKKDVNGKFTIIPKVFVKDPCPTCNKRLMVKTGRYGRFFACEDYPNCKTALPYTLDIHCPECKVGKLAEKKSRYGKIFYGCSTYPKCNFAMWFLPRAFPCPECKYPVTGQRVTKRNGDHLECTKCHHKTPLQDTPFYVPAENSGPQ